MWIPSVMQSGGGGLSGPKMLEMDSNYPHDSPGKTETFFLSFFWGGFF